VDDITPPIINCPVDVTFACFTDAPDLLQYYADFIIGGGSASDNCGLDTTTYAFNETVLGTCDQIITRTYSIADSCGNISQCIQNITIEYDPFPAYCTYNGCG
jgi:hypothetical protein